MEGSVITIASALPDRVPPLAERIADGFAEWRGIAAAGIQQGLST